MPVLRYIITFMYHFFPDKLQTPVEPCLREIKHDGSIVCPILWIKFAF